MKTVSQYTVHGLLDASDNMKSGVTEACKLISRGTTLHKTVERGMNWDS